VRQRVGANYFRTLGVPVVRGRDFEARDLVTDGVAAPAILNQTAARTLFGDTDPIGRTLRQDSARYTVIGIARDTKSAILTARAAPTLFVPMPQTQGGFVLLRSPDRLNVMESVRQELAAESRLTIFNARTMPEYFDSMRASVKVGSVFYIGLGAFGLILAAIGLAGVTAYAVARRKKEIGVRMALGARAVQVLQLVLREGAVLVGVGSILGLLGAWGASRALAATMDVLAQAFDSSAGNPVLLVGAPLLLAGISLAACFIPARRSARIDPLTALREE
jgi:ABC-type antimicrobial peptide transport system permease subunit